VSILQELRRRKVFRLAALYIVGAWVCLQVADLAFESWDITSSALRYVWLGAILGFPVALVFGWRYDITTQGIVRTPQTGADTQIDLSLRRSDYVILALLMVVAVGVIYQLTVRISNSRSPQLTEVSQQYIEPNSIAVLPFADMSINKDQEYFSDGLSDTLIHVLAQVSGLRVTAKTSSFYFKGKNIDVGEIARELNVGTILEGSVQKDGNKVRVIAQLINAGDGTHLWSKSFDRDLEDIFAIHDEIAQEVVRALKVTLLDAEEKRLAQRYQPTLEAYGELILGRHEMAKRTATSLSAAEQHFKQAIELDPNYALAYVNLSETYGLQWLNSGLLIEESLKRRQPLIEKALELDPLSGEAHVERASFVEHLQLKTAGEDQGAVEENILKALKLSPNYARVHIWYSGILWSQGRFEEALAQIQLAAELDPMSPTIQTSLASATWDTGRVEEALALIRRNIERNPEFPNNYNLMAGYLVQLGHLGEAQLWFREVRWRNPAQQYSWWAECVGYIRLGDLQSAEDCGKQFSEAFPQTLLPQVVQAALADVRGELKKAISILESVSERLPGWGPFARWWANLVARQGDIELARRIMGDAFPELLENELEIGYGDYHLAEVMHFAAILHANGETQQGDALLQALEKRIATLHRIRGVAYGILDVYIHAIRGDNDLAITALREAIDMGWKGGNWQFVSGLRQDWILGSLRQDPEFVALIIELEGELEVQRQWYEENKDKPLF
jgi:TolB-like protein/Tfp pilus assembly protein PilF